MTESPATLDDKTEALMAEAFAPDEYGRTSPLAIYVRYPGRGETVLRNQSIPDDVRRTVHRYREQGCRVHVSYDTCG